VLIKTIVLRPDVNKRIVRKDLTKAHSFSSATSRGFENGHTVPAVRP